MTGSQRALSRFAAVMAAAIMSLQGQALAQQSAGAARANAQLDACDKTDGPPQIAIAECTAALAYPELSTFGSIRAWLGRGTQFLRARDYASAEKDFTSAFQFIGMSQQRLANPGNHFDARKARASYGLGLAYYGVGRNDEGQRAIAWGISLDSSVEANFAGIGLSRPGTAVAAAPPVAPKPATPPAAPVAGGNAGLDGCVSIADTPSHPFVNKCKFMVAITFCVLQPRAGAWSEAFDCEKKLGALETIGAESYTGAHNSGGVMTYWYVCKFPATPWQVRYERGRGLIGTCR
jgi:hypothetical protein